MAWNWVRAGLGCISGKGSSPRGWLGTGTAPQGSGHSTSLREFKKWLDSALRHIRWFLGLSCAEPGVWSWWVLPTLHFYDSVIDPRMNCGCIAGMGKKGTDRRKEVKAVGAWGDYTGAWRKANPIGQRQFCIRQFCAVDSISFLSSCCKGWTLPKRDIEIPIFFIINLKSCHFGYSSASMSLDHLMLIEMFEYLMKNKLMNLYVLYFRSTSKCSK